MSSIRNQKYFQQMPENIIKLGGYSVSFLAVPKWSGLVASGTYVGQDAVVLDFTANAWAAANKRVIVIAESASDAGRLPDAMKTQSHASGHFIDGSSRFHVFCETPAAFTDDHAKFLRIVQQHITGQLAAPMKLWACANTVQPEIEGVDGAVASAAFTDAGWVLPYGYAVAGGV